ncbi:MAG: spermidine/putrescine ABC transporter permease [Gammaproteobacteria bacterium SG8_47]|nr:MAG: spermidine/putrescine ABC transporter permease [Gammaproteobacteria bacterium SG8_47]
MKLRTPFRTAVLALIWGWMIVFVFLPNLLVIATSFLTRDDVHFIRLEGSLASYARLLDPVYAGVFTHSLYMALVTTGLCLLIGYPFAYIVSRLPQRHKPLLIFLVILPFWTNSLVRTYAMKLLLSANGLINQFLLGVGVIDAPLRMLYTEGAVIAGLVYVLLPFMILPLYAIFEQLRVDLLDASADLGAGRWRTFRYVVLPLTMPGVIAGCLLVLIPAVGMFYVADVLGGAKNLLVGNVIKSQFLDARDWPFGAAASIGLTVAMGLLLYAYYWSVRLARHRGEHGALA